MQYTLNTPLTKDKLRNLKAGDYVCLSGTIYSARDAAHLRMHQALAESGALPIPLADAAIYYMGPLPPSGVCRGTAFPMYRGVQGYCLRRFGYSGSPPAHCEGFPYDRNY